MGFIFEILGAPMGYILRFAYSITNDFLLSIMLFTLVMEIILLPLGIKQQKNQVKQASFAPRIAAIKKKYAGRNDQATQQKMQNEIMELYRSENFNPAGGCGTLLIQFPIIIALFQVITNPLRYLCKIPAEQVTKLLEVMKGAEIISTKNGSYLDYQVINYFRANPDAISNYTGVECAPALEGVRFPDFTLFSSSIDLSANPSFNPFNWLIIIPVLTFVVMIVSQKIMQKFTYQSPENAEAQNRTSMKIMTWTMPLLSVYFEFQMPAIIGVYWIFRNIISTVQRIILSKVIPVPQYTEEDFKEAERQANMSNKQRKREQKENGDKKFVRSLHYIDDEEYIARHAEDLEEEAANAGAKADAKLAPAPLKDDKKAQPEKKEVKNQAESAEEEK